MLIVKPQSIVAAMLRQGFSVGELARRSGVSVSTISKIANHKGTNAKPITLGIAGKIAKTLQLDIDDILVNVKH